MTNPAENTRRTRLRMSGSKGCVGVVVPVGLVVPVVVVGNVESTTAKDSVLLQALTASWSSTARTRM